MATIPHAPAPIEQDIDADWPDDVDPWEGFTPEERERGWRILTPEESRADFDRVAQRWMGIGGDEFVRRWNAGEYDEIADKEGHRHIMDLALMAGLVGR